MKKKFTLTVTQRLLSEMSNLSALGMNMTQIYQYYGLTKDEFYEMRNEHPEIHTAINRGKAKQLASVSAKLLDKVAQGDVKAIQFYLSSMGWAKYANDAYREPEFEDIADIKISSTDPVEAAKIYQDFMKG